MVRARFIQRALSRCISYLQFAMETSTDEVLSIQGAGERKGRTRGCRPAPGALSSNSSIKNLNKTMLNSWFRAMAGLQFLAGMKECS
jgi:hypothetical protein